MTKEEVIKEAYGEYWNLFFLSLQDRILDNNGNLDYFLLPKVVRDATEKICDIRSHKSIFECTNTDEGTPRFFKPKSLKGIENNNGWTKIESEKDLPQDIHHVYMVARDKEILFKSGVTKITVDYLYATGKITHYQQIQEFKPPIF